jgi:hypothetical protein
MAISRTTKRTIVASLLALLALAWVDVGGPGALYGSTGIRRRRDHPKLFHSLHTLPDALLRATSQISGVDSPIGENIESVSTPSNRSRASRSIGEGNRRRQIIEVADGELRALIAEPRAGETDRSVILSIAGSEPLRVGPPIAEAVETLGSLDQAIGEGDWNAAARASEQLRYEVGRQLTHAKALDELDNAIQLGRDLLSCFERLGAETSVRPVTVGPIPTGVSQKTTEAAETHDSLAGVAQATSGRRDSPPDVRAILDKLDRLRQRPGHKALADRLQLDLAMRTLYEGHPARARDMLPAPGSADPEHAAALLRDFKLLLTGHGEPATWPTQEAVRPEPSSSGSGGPRPPPPFLPPPSPETGVAPTFVARSALDLLPQLDAETARPPRARPGERSLPGPLATELERSNKFLRIALRAENDHVRERLHTLRPRMFRIHCPLEDEDTELLACIRGQLADAARRLETLRREDLTAPELAGMPGWYPPILAYYLRSGLTQRECIAVHQRRGSVATPGRNAELVVRERIQRFATVAPRTGDILLYRVLNLSSEDLTQLFEDLPEPFVQHLEDYCLRDDEPGAGLGPGAQPPRGNDRYHPKVDQLDRHRLIRALADPGVVFMFARQRGDQRSSERRPIDPCDEAASRELLKDLAPILAGAMPAEDAERWTKPLLGLTADQRSAAISSNPFPGP